MNSLIRSPLAVLTGAIVAGSLIFAIEAVGHLVYPPPPGLDLSDREALAALIAGAPTGALLFVLAAWGIGTLTGAWLAAWLAGRAPVAHGLIIGVLFLLAGIANLVTIPHPAWFTVAGVALFLPAAWLGAKLAGRRRAAVTPA